MVNLQQCKVLFVLILLFSFGCKAEDQDATIDNRQFEGSWYYTGKSETTVLSFYNNVVYKDILIDDKIKEHTDFGMIQSVSKEHIRIADKTYSYRLDEGSLLLKGVIIDNKVVNEWVEFKSGTQLY